MTAPTVNTELLLKIYDKVSAEPEAWDQGNWGQQTECGTTYCIAGWACVLSGLDVQFTCAPGIAAVRAGGLPVAFRAADLLNLDEYQAYDLFYDTGNDLAEFAEKIQRFTGIDVDDRVVSVG